MNNNEPVNIHKRVSTLIRPYQENLIDENSWIVNNFA